VGVESSNLFCSIALLFSTPDGNRRRAFFISVQHGGNRRLVTSASQRRQRTENLISLKNPWHFGLKRDFFSADSPLVKSMTSTTIKTLDLYFFHLSENSSENSRKTFLSTKNAMSRGQELLFSSNSSPFIFTFGEFCPKAPRDDLFPALEHYLRKGEKPALVLHGKIMQIYLGEDIR
jgi:hypothetical protein